MTESKETGVLIGLLGRPGSGKTTAGEAIAGLDEVALLRVGGLLAEEVERGSPAGREIARTPEGGLAPTGPVLQVVERCANESVAPVVVLDGFPRTRDQAEAIGGLERATGRRFASLIVLALPRSVAERRLNGRRVCAGCGRVYNIHSDPPPPDACADCAGGLERRDDDRPEVVSRRQDRYERDTKPVVHWFADDSPERLRCVRASGSPDVVGSRLRQALDGAVTTRGPGASTSEN